MVAAYNNSSWIRLRLDLELVLLSIDQAIPCGLILNELVTNSLKYAFPETHSGEIAVELHCADEKGVILRVVDNGTGLPPGFDWKQSESLGLRIVRILATQLNGVLDCAAGAGVAFTLTFARDEPKADVKHPKEPSYGR